MTLPRQVLVGQTYFVTRRVAQGPFLVRPDPLVNQIFRYCLAWAAKRHPVKIHAAFVASNHFHLVLTDEDRNLPRFMEHLDKFVANCMNVALDRCEGFWSTRHYNALPLCYDEDVLDKLLYLLVNPVASWLVAFAFEWPGVWFGIGGFGPQSYTERRPEVFFSPKTTAPEEVSLTVSPFERFFSDQSPAEFDKLLRRRAFEREHEIRNRARPDGKRFLGREAILAQSPWDYPKTRQARGGLNPHVACLDKWKRIALLLALRAFRLRYREALDQFRAGLRTVLFPIGTYWLRVFQGALCEPEPDTT